MKIVENQKLGKIVKAKTDKDNVYGLVNKDCMYKAMKNLTYNEFKVYLYMITNQNGYEFAISTKHIAEVTGISDVGNVRKVITNLIEKGYCVERGNVRTFYEDKERVNSTRVENEACKNNTSGSVNSTRGVVLNLHEGRVNSTREIIQNNILYNTNNNTKQILNSSLIDLIKIYKKNIRIRKETIDKYTNNIPQDANLLIVEELFKEQINQFGEPKDAKTFSCMLSYANKRYTERVEQEKAEERKQQQEQELKLKEQLDMDEFNKYLDDNNIKPNDWQEEFKIWKYEKKLEQEQQINNTKQKLNVAPKVDISDFID